MYSQPRPNIFRERFCSECVKVRSINFATAKVLQIFRNTLEQGGDKKKPDTNKGSIKSQRNLIQQGFRKWQSTIGQF